MDGKLQVVLIFAMMASILGWRPFSVKFLSVNHKVFHPDILDYNMTLKNHTIFDLHLNLKRVLPSVFMDFEVMMDTGGGTYDMAYMNRTVDMCMFLRNRKSNSILDIMYRVLKPYGELPNGCPIPRRLYKLRNVFIDPEKFPPYVPDLKSSLKGTMRTKDKNNILLVLMAEVEFEKSFKNTEK